MPRAARTCNNCHTIISAGQSRCTNCTRQADHIRGTATERGYTSKGHRVFRRAVLRRDPICIICKTAWSTVADHWPTSRRELEHAGLNPNDARYGRGLCATCHNSETARHQPGGWHAQHH